MDNLADARRRAFSVWLRTGRLPGWLKATPEFKFNPWHDPDNGRFTFAGTGRYFGRGSGAAAADGNSAAHSDRRRSGPRGGSGGSGGGVTGRLDKSPASTGPQPKPHEQGFPSEGGSFGGGGGESGGYEVDPTGARLFRSLISPAIARRAAEENWRRVTRNGYHFLVDASGRTRHVSGVVVLNIGQGRSRSAQASAGRPDRRLSDDGGHYIARRFNGPTEAFNHFAQDANFNRGAYRALEDQWARAIRAGKAVMVRVVPSYDASSRRPSRINVWFWIDGEENSVRFPNEPREKPNAKR